MCQSKGGPCVGLRMVRVPVLVQSVCWTTGILYDGLRVVHVPV